MIDALIKFAEAQMELQPHFVAWRLGASMFGFDGEKIPDPVGLVVGDAPDRNSNPLLPLFPHPEDSTGSRLLGYGNLRYEDFLGKLIRVNLDEWGTAQESEKKERVEIFRDEAAARQLRVLLVGNRVRDAFGCTREFGRARLASRNGKPVDVGWVPSMDKLNRRSDYIAQEMTGLYVRWVAGGREP